MLEEGMLDGSTRRFVIRPTCNQRSVRIEEMVARRKNVHVQMLENEMYELQDKVPPTLRALLEGMLKKARAEHAAGLGLGAVYCQLIETQHCVLSEYHLNAIQLSFARHLAAS